MSKSDILLYELRDKVAVITLNRPDALNALNLELGAELSATIDRAAEEAGAIALFGSGRAFCSGADLNSDRSSSDGNDPDMGEYLERLYNPMMQKLANVPIPYLVGVQGAAAGIGCSVALMGDIIVAGKSAYFLQAFCNIGLVPDGGSAYLLAKSIGRVKAMELMLLGERYPAAEAHKAGLITRLVEDHEIESTVMELANRLANGPSKTLSLIRQSAWAALDSNLENQLAHERIAQREAGYTEDFKEGVAAFKEKRKPAFKGK